MAEEKKTRWQVKAVHHLVDVHNMLRFGSEIFPMNDTFSENVVLKFGVNWSAMGTKSPEETEEFARNLLDASRLCEKINKIGITSDEWNERV